MKVGDLVQIQKWCKNKYKVGFIIEAPDALNCVKIMLQETGEIMSAVKGNLILISSLEDK